MIRIHDVEITDVRGIRSLRLSPNGANFAICGPNGSGKSGVVDAIEFGLTGSISRLTGKGTGGLSLKAHGPHVDSLDCPDSAGVRLTLEIPGIQEKVCLERTIATPGTPVVSPDRADVRAYLARVEAHAELTLSRREIIKYILTDPGSRSKAVQELLRLDRIDQLRASLSSADRRLSREATAAEGERQSAEDDLGRHLDLPSLESDRVLEVVNRHRRELGLDALLTLTEETRLDQGGLPEVKATPHKSSAARDLNEMRYLFDAAIPSVPGWDPEVVREKLGQLRRDPELRTAARRLQFLNTGHRFIEDAHADVVCPFCSSEWSAEELREVVAQNLRAAEDAKSAVEALCTAADTLQKKLREVAGLADRAAELARLLEDEQAAVVLARWRASLLKLATELDDIDGLLRVESKVSTDWRQLSKGLEGAFRALLARIDALPDGEPKSASVSFLAKAEERYERLIGRRQRERDVQAAADRSKSAASAYADAIELTFGSLYRDIGANLSSFYRLLNQDDEYGFEAKLRHAAGKLGLDVDFHSRGLFPPGAYHSEGHQDGMGLCMYLALMRQLLGEQFTFALLDDVVMSVDSQHRREVCKLLNTEFPDTQFIITTHDETWYHQMRSAGLVSRRSSVLFQGWLVETGPVVADPGDPWADVEAALATSDVPGAASRLRRYLEFVSRELAENLQARVAFRGDGNHALGDVLPAVIGRYTDLLKKAAAAAQSWGNQEAGAKIQASRDEFSSLAQASNAERWAINPAVHYNAWANLSKEDFAPVVESQRALLASLRCTKCNTFVQVLPSAGPAEVLKCDCQGLSWNLKRKGRQL